MILRLFVIVMAFGAAALQASRGAWVEAAGLVGLASGLLALRMWPGRPATRWLAGAGFSVTALAMVVVALRMRG